MQQGGCMAPSRADCVHVGWAPKAEQHGSRVTLGHHLHCCWGERACLCVVISTPRSRGGACFRPPPAQEAQLSNQLSGGRAGWAIQFPTASLLSRVHFRFLIGLSSLQLHFISCKLHVIALAG